MPSVMDEIRAFRVEKGSVALWWLGQSGFVFKSPEGTTVCVDAYLTHSCDGLVPGMDLIRKVPVELRPEELEVDVFTCTHNHQDHTDPETVRHLRHKDTMQFVGPPPSCDVYAAEGVESGRIVPAWPDVDLEFGDLRIHGTWALPTDASDLNHMGYVFQFGNGPKIWVTGDTDYHELLTSARKHEPDVVLTVINGGFNNLSHWEAAELVGKVGPKVAIPTHYDMFPDNHVDPKQFRASMTQKAPDVRYHELTHFQRWVFEKP
ncbi:MAG: MBL fold metallo-hydrolase [Bryobacteraceae bacterium]|nr:MBL fold metallo-hydrolase [Bryobacteraceae bacterium]